MIYHYPIAFLEASESFTAFHDLAAWLMTADYILVSFRTLAEMFSIDCSDVTSADSGRFHLDEDLSVTWFRNRYFLQLDCAVTR
jgi:hypothetical protein